MIGADLIRVGSDFGEARRLARITEAELSNHEGLTPAQHHELKALRDSYGKTILRKARALALLRVRSGKRLLADAQAAEWSPRSLAPCAIGSRSTPAIVADTV